MWIMLMSTYSFRSSDRPWKAPGMMVLIKLCLRSLERKRKILGQWENACRDDVETSGEGFFKWKWRGVVDTHVPTWLLQWETAGYFCTQIGNLTPSATWAWHQQNADTWPSKILVEYKTASKGFCRFSASLKMTLPTTNLATAAP